MSKLNLGYDIRYGNELGFGCMATALGDEREDCETISGGVLDDLLHLPPVEGMPSKMDSAPLDPKRRIIDGKNSNALDSNLTETCPPLCSPDVFDC